MKGSLRIFADYFQAACLDRVGWALAAHAFRPEGSLKPRRHECPPRICFYPIQPLYENGKFKNLTNNC